MIVIGLTGSIATGKSRVVKWLKELDLPVYDADAHVHDMFKHDPQVIAAIKNLWPDCVGEDGVDRSCLRRKVLEAPETIKQLEVITHPVVRRLNQEFIEHHRLAGDPVVFLDIPLLFETKSATYDAILVVYCSPEHQRERALARGGDPALFEYLLSQQLPLEEKIKKADFILSSDGELAETHKKLIEVLHQIEQRFGIKIIGAYDA
jgi:dephospho-CoA kinase